MNELVESGIGIVIVSADITEILGMCDRFLVLHQGRVARILTPDEADEALVLAYATGEHPDD